MREPGSRSNSKAEQSLFRAVPLVTIIACSPGAPVGLQRNHSEREAFLGDPIETIYRRIVAPDRWYTFITMRICLSMQVSLGLHLST